MGCKAGQVQTIDEGVNRQGPESLGEFWTILGGQTAYQRKTWTSKFIGLAYMCPFNTAGFLWVL